jgi:hypothetical protein
MAVLFAARDGEARQFQAPGLPELHLGGLDPGAAGELLAAQAGSLAWQVRDRLITESGGDPLALLELPAGLSSQQLAGHQLLPHRLPLSARLQQVFLERVWRLPAATQRLLVVAAAEDTGELATILAASDVLGVDKEALAPAEQAGLVQVVDSQLVFRHRLVRSAVYQQATVFGRRAAHRALVEVLKGAQQQDRRAWHLAAASLGPDEDIARAWRPRPTGPAAAAAPARPPRPWNAPPRSPPRWRPGFGGWSALPSSCGRPAIPQAQALLDRVETAWDERSGHGVLPLRSMVRAGIGGRGASTVDVAAPPPAEHLRA